MLDMSFWHFDLEDIQNKTLANGKKGLFYIQA